ncbi:hypothetical protein GCM10023231_00500 [Olivibacter ginsenosidimutans]|uniref:Helix-turn-helix domain-containing protein n=1 Tax=Olivibacter ginsenosidimutans TaxID=1176537 RepID=A0ABP9AE84_9SPHI
MMLNKFDQLLETVKSIHALLDAMHDPQKSEKKTEFLNASLLAQEGMPKTLSDEVLYNAKYAADRIGVSDKTIGRLTQRGDLPVVAVKRRKRQFRLSDIERCRRYYRGEG